MLFSREFLVYAREKTSDKWTQAKNMTRAEVFAAIDGMLTDSKGVLRLKIHKVNQERK